jgi:hypothetical protein
MIPRRIAGATLNLGPPEGWDKGECSPLAVRVENDTGYSVCASAWEPTPEELTRLVTGGSVVLRVFGMQPPVALTVEGGDP